jgi:hypothetical protein
MKADTERSPQRAEKEALQWAIEYFRKNADEMTPEGSRRWALHDMLLGCLMRYNDPRERTEMEKEIDETVDLAWLGSQEHSRYARGFAAALMERGDPLPGKLHHFIVEFLRNPEKPQIPPHAGGEEFDALIDRVRSHMARKPGQRAIDLQPRNVSIWAAVEHIVRTWKIPPTRNEATKNACATSIVREALEKGAGVKLKEAAVVKVWRKMRSGGNEVLALYPSGLDRLIIGGP